MYHGPTIGSLKEGQCTMDRPLVVYKEFDRFYLATSMCIFIFIAYILSDYREDLCE